MKVEFTADFVPLVSNYWFWIMVCMAVVDTLYTGYLFRRIATLEDQLRAKGKT